VLACATKRLDIRVTSQNQMTLEREPLERDLQFLGFLILLNKLKPITKPIISNLNHAHLKSVMVTGDNPLTAICVARECGLVHPDQKVVLGIGIKEDHQSEVTVQWSDVEFSSFKPISTSFSRNQSFYGETSSMIDIEKPRARTRSCQYNSLDDAQSIKKVYSEPAKLLKMLETSHKVVVAMNGKIILKFLIFIIRKEVLLRSFKNV